MHHQLRMERKREMDLFFFWYEFKLNRYCINQANAPPTHNTQAVKVAAANRKSNCKVPLLLLNCLLVDAERGIEPCPLSTVKTIKINKLPRLVQQFFVLFLGYFIYSFTRKTTNNTLNARFLFYTVCTQLNSKKVICWF